MTLLDGLNSVLNDIIRDVATLRTISGTLLATVITILVGFWVYANYFENTERPAAKRDSNLPPPSEIVALWIYPIKSCRGIKLKRAMLRKTGLDLDRNWVFVDSEDQFQTIRQNAAMTLINTALSDDQKDLTVSISGTDTSVTISTRPSQEWLESNTTLQRVHIWGADTDGWAYNDSINSVFTPHFGKAVKLVYKGPSPRKGGGNAAENLYGKSNTHMFADVMSLLVASQASMEDLNRRLEGNPNVPEVLPIERFRPNIVIKGNKPWEEDGWKRVQIVTVDHEREQLRRLNLDVLAHCARCQVPNVDPSTAEKNAKDEPYKTLMSFRRIDDGGVAKYKPCFGMLCIPENQGEIILGSTVEPLRMTTKHRYSEAKFADL